MTDRIVVTGATGKVGGQVVRQLVAAGREVRAVVRDSSKARLAGAEVVRGDLGEPDTIAAAAEESEAAFLLWPYLGTPADTVPDVVAALAKRTARIVVLSSMGVVDGVDRQKDPNSEFHAALEREVRRSGAEWTFVRPGGFAGNTLGWASTIRAEGVVRAAYAQLARPLIHEADIAAVAVAALTGDGHAGATYAVTGPALVTQAEQMAAIGAAIGRELRFEELAPAEAQRQLRAAGWPTEMADSAMRTWSRMLARPEPVTTTVQDVLGRPALTYQQWAVDHADDFR
ncbi:NAD(P)H-binding protein [Fodinicola acaciae]|uniref:NAD(P)H-binding protein n=1 Tax=Fodinicola acaciae TaxID=2681555 RepID=UPI0013CF9630|nr:NAD(P)H-binding protein [Fodinicola acaciae]